ncbi:LacI family transcriptional regulator [Planosporangium thailandense]|uniref:LacI family transcriptional regulator n=1 Tax=Planosporangium thailandense TaxID=765197 RepID=A0ABX0Y687_9ACTN|nr:LacI family DNA-binding transcriptional regulator [Planosporangium thailandense]NJC73075.1 LacI family transcriptional regulator [Planosporangium thailandense]
MSLDAEGVSRRGVTLKEIARRTGVHVSTVSRVLRQAPPPDGWSDVALKIRETARELGYQPNPWAASLRTRRTGVLGAVMPRLTDGVIAKMYQGVQQAAEEAGYSVLLSSPEDDLVAMKKAINLVVGRYVDGLILSGLRRPGPPFLASLNVGNTPVLLLSRHADTDLPSVTSDDYEGGRLAARHLVELGHQRCGIIAGPKDASTASERVAGFLDGLKEAGLRQDRRLIVPSGFGVNGGVEAARVILGDKDRPTAIFAINDDAAIGALGVARDLGITVPTGLSVVGFNDADVSAQLPVPLTSIRTQPRVMGATAVHRLLRLMGNEEVGSVKLPVELVVRSSTVAPPGVR